MYLRYLLIIFTLCCSLLASAQYSSIDRHARTAPDSLQRDLPRLVAYLIEAAENETEKARALYTWLISNLEYDDAAAGEGRRINQHIGDILQRRRGICFDYSQLYTEMCRLAGLECYSVSGYSRQGLGSLPELTQPNHSWNAVQLDGKWQLLDATWGSIDGQDELMAVYQTDYFLTPPRLFTLNHLPAIPMWQLMDCPILPEQFVRPAESLLDIIDSTAGCDYAFRDSIKAFFQLPEAEAMLWIAQATHRFLPTKENQRALAQALVDYAVYLSDEANRLQQQDSLQAYTEVQARAIAHCEKAAALDSLRGWQTELYAGLLINQAVAFSRLSDEVEGGKAQLELLQKAAAHLQQAQKVLLNLPQDNYYRQYAGQQCEAYLEAVRHNISLLE